MTPFEIANCLLFLNKFDYAHLIRFFATEPKASGPHKNRPQLNAALDYLREGDTLVVWKLSRLARSLTQVIKTAAKINERGIALKVLTQNIDTTTPEGQLFFHMTAAFDELQQELIVENTQLV